MNDLIALLQPYLLPAGDGIFESDVPLTLDELNLLIGRIGLSNEDHGIFSKARKAIRKNYRQHDCPPEKYKGDDDVVWAYLKGTPLVQLSRRTRCVDLMNRMAHTHDPRRQWQW